MIGRQYGRLAAPDIAAHLNRRSVLCRPLNTDTIMAGRFTTRLVQHHDEECDLWSLPALPYGLALEHA
ncbi:MAG: hypothetical protein JO272_15450 [Pseudonocardiales bacterium]|nr:hypothetical protein [Pseudonocardiales bacterium]